MLFRSVKVGAGADVTKVDGDNVMYGRKAGGGRSIFIGLEVAGVGVQHCTLFSIMRACDAVQSSSENLPIIPFKAAHE